MRFIFCMITSALVFCSIQYDITSTRSPCPRQALCTDTAIDISLVAGSKRTRGGSCSNGSCPRSSYADEAIFAGECGRMCSVPRTGTCLREPRALLKVVLIYIYFAASLQLYTVGTVSATIIKIWHDMYNTSMCSESVTLGPVDLQEQVCTDDCGFQYSWITSSYNYRSKQFCN